MSIRKAIDELRESVDHQATRTLGDIYEHIKKLEAEIAIEGKKFDEMLSESIERNNRVAVLTVENDKLKRKLGEAVISSGDEDIEEVNRNKLASAFAKEISKDLLSLKEVKANEEVKATTYQYRAGQRVECGSDKKEKTYSHYGQNSLGGWFHFMKDRGGWIDEHVRPLWEVGDRVEFEAWNDEVVTGKIISFYKALGGDAAWIDIGKRNPEGNVLKQLKWLSQKEETDKDDVKKTLTLDETKEILGSEEAVCPRKAAHKETHSWYCKYVEMMVECDELRRENETIRQVQHCRQTQRSGVERRGNKSLMEDCAHIHDFRRESDAVSMLGANTQLDKKRLDKEKLTEVRHAAHLLREENDRLCTLNCGLQTDLMDLKKAFVQFAPKDAVDRVLVGFSEREAMRRVETHETREERSLGPRRIEKGGSYTDRAYPPFAFDMDRQKQRRVVLGTKQDRK